MTKRKVEFDLTDEESSGKKIKVDNTESSTNEESKGKETKISIENPLMNKLIINGLIDFSNTESRKKYNPDIDIISSDGTTLKYHICKLVDNSIFNQFINDCKHNEGEIRKIKLELFDTQTINLALNYIDKKEIFVEKMTHKDTRCGRNILPKLLDLAKYLNMDDLFKFCCYCIENHCRVYNINLECYSKHKLDNSVFFKNILRGRIPKGEKLPVEYLSRCFDYGMKNNVEGTILYVLPIYCPTDDQMKPFHFTPLPSNIFISGDEMVANRHRTRRFMNGAVTDTTIEMFLTKYKNEKNVPEGVQKFLHRLAELCFVI